MNDYEDRFGVCEGPNHAGSRLVDETELTYRPQGNVLICIECVADELEARTVKR